MNLRDLICGISLRLPADISEENLIQYINSAIRRFGRYIGKYAVSEIRGDGRNSYMLPENVKPECISSVVVGDREILPSTAKKDGVYILEPDGRITFGFKVYEIIKIYHHSCCEAKERKDAGDNFDRQDMGIDGEYADAVIFSVLSDYCEACEDITAANNYRSKCDEIIKNAMQGRYRKRGGYPVTCDVMK